MVRETGSPKLLFENLDLTPIHSILWTDLHTEGPGRPVEYQPEWDLKALMLRQLEQIPYVKALVKRLRRNPYLRQVCGYGDWPPCEAHFSQMKRRIGAEGFRAIESWLRREALRLRRSHPLSAVGLVQAAQEMSARKPKEVEGHHDYDVMRRWVGRFRVLRRLAWWLPQAPTIDPSLLKEIRRARAQCLYQIWDI